MGALVEGGPAGWSEPDPRLGYALVMWMTKERWPLRLPGESIPESTGLWAFDELVAAMTTWSAQLKAEGRAEGRPDCWSAWRGSGQHNGCPARTGEVGGSARRNRGAPTDLRERRRPDCQDPADLVVSVWTAAAGGLSSASGLPCGCSRAARVRPRGDDRRQVGKTMAILGGWLGKALLPEGCKRSGMRWTTEPVPCSPRAAASSAGTTRTIGSAGRRWTERFVTNLTHTLPACLARACR